MVGLSVELFQKILLRTTTCNTTRKSRLQLTAEHDRLELWFKCVPYLALIYGGKVIQNIGKSTLNLQPELKISIVDLQVDNVPTEKFLLCRVMFKWIRMNALITVVEDPEGNVERLALYNMFLESDTPQNSELNQLDDDQILDNDQFLPVGTQLVIKNPTYEIDDGMIRSDNPEDIIVIDHVNKLFSDLEWSTDLIEDVTKDTFTSDDYYRYGNECFNLNDYKTAIDMYSTSVRLGPQNVVLFTNRAAAYLKLKIFDRALDDVEIALKYEPNHIEAACHKTKALCGLKRYQEALITIQDLSQRVKVDSGASSSIKQGTEELLEHVKMLVSESKRGKYDYTSIINEFCEKARTREDRKGWVNKEGPRLDHADFLIDDIEIRPIEGKGRGWFAKRDIPGGTLLMVSKAFQIVYNINEGERFIEELMTRTSHDLMFALDLHDDVYELCCGSAGSALDHDFVRVCQNLEHNITTTTTSEINDSEIVYGVGLWVLPSYFNHTCVDKNVSPRFIGDLMFVRTLRPVSKGEELVFNYYEINHNDHDYEERTRFLQKFDIFCQCRLCKFDRSEAPATKLRRAQILENYEKSIKPRLSLAFDPSLTKEIEEIIAELRSLREGHPDLEFDSIELIKDLATFYPSSNNPTILEEAYKFARKAHYLSSSLALEITLFYFKQMQMNEASKWADITLKEFVEPVRGKFKENESNWKEEAMSMMKTFLSKENFAVFLKLQN